MAKVFPKCLVKKHVEERVDAAVGGGNDSRDLNGFVQVVTVPTAMQGELFVESRQEKCNIVGSPHQKENCCYGGNKLAKIIVPLPELACSPHSHAAIYKSKQWQKKSQNVHL